MDSARRAMRMGGVVACAAASSAAAFGRVAVCVDVWWYWHLMFCNPMCIWECLVGRRVLGCDIDGKDRLGDCSRFRPPLV